MMKNLVEKFVTKGRRIMAFAIAVAMLMSMFSPASFAEAASWKKPALKVKKKTLYYNKAGRKTYTLKVKKNNVKKLKKTTWKTSKKSVIAISKKKKTSVKLKAKKAGKATITATIKYVPKGLWMVRTLKLKCKVTSKKFGKTPTPKPTVKPSDVVKKVTLDSTKEILSTASEKNTVTLTATVFNASNKEMDIDEDDIKWASSSKKVATVDDEGNVTAVKDGTANITASYGGVKSAPCVVIVDSKAPVVKEAKVTSANTITVYFSEAVKGEPEVSVKNKTDDESLDSDKIEAKLAKDGKSMTVTYKEELSNVSYEMTIDGLSDMAGNEMAEDTKVAFEKMESTPTKIVGVTDRITVSQTKVYFKVLDQYNKEMAGDFSSDITADAATENGIPLDVLVKYDGNCYVEISNTEFLLNRKININLSYNKTVKGKITVTVVKADDNVGEAESISGFKVNNSNMTTAYTHVLQKERDDTLNIKAIMVDKFGSQINSSTVSYHIDNTDVLTFGNGTPNQISEDGETNVTAIDKGEATITAYLLSSGKSEKLTVTVTDEVVIERLEINDAVKVSSTSTASPAPPYCISLSKGDGLNIATYDAVEFELKAYDKNGKEIEGIDTTTNFAAKIVSKENQVQGRELFSDKSGDNYYKFAIQGEGNGVINDSVEITIEHIPTKIKTTASVPVSNRSSKPKLNECEIVQADYKEKNLCNETYEMNFAEKNKEVDFKVQTTDQYGVEFVGRCFSTIRSSNPDVAEVTNLNEDNIFSIIPKRLGETTITVYLTSGIIRTFTIKMMEEINVVDEFKKKADILAKDYYESSDTEPILENKDKKKLYFKIPIKGVESTNNSLIKEVFLGDVELLNGDNASKVSVGNNRFITLSDYIEDNGTLLISYLFVALNNVDQNGKMKFTIKFTDGSKAEAVLKVTELSEDLKCASIKPALEKGATVKIASGRDKDKELSATTAGELISTSGIRECTLELMNTATENTWKHMVLLKFEVDGMGTYKQPEYYFTKKVVGKNISYGFTKAEKTGELGYYPYNYDSLSNGEKITDYTVATVDRHSVSNIKLIQKKKETQSATTN